MKCLSRKALLVILSLGMPFSHAHASDIDYSSNKFKVALGFVATVAAATFVATKIVLGLNKKNAEQATIIQSLISQQEDLDGLVYSTFSAMEQSNQAYLACLDQEACYARRQCKIVKKIYEQKRKKAQPHRAPKRLFKSAFTWHEGCTVPPFSPLYSKDNTGLLREVSILTENRIQRTKKYYSEIRKSTEENANVLLSMEKDWEEAVREKNMLEEQQKIIKESLSDTFTPTVVRNIIDYSCLP